MYLTAPGHGKFVNEENVFRDFVAGDFIPAEVLYVRSLHGYSFVQNDESPYCLSIFFRWDARYLYVLHSVELIEEFLYLTGIDILSTTDDHIFDTSCDTIIPIFVLDSQVS